MSCSGRETIPSTGLLRPKRSRKALPTRQCMAFLALADCGRALFLPSSHRITRTHGTSKLQIRRRCSRFNDPPVDGFVSARRLRADPGPSTPEGDCPFPARLFFIPRQSSGGVGGGVHFCLRILVLVALARRLGFSHREKYPGGFSPVDKVVALWTVSALIAFLLQFPTTDALIQGLGTLVDSCGVTWWQDSSFPTARRCGAPSGCSPWFASFRAFP